MPITKPKHIRPEHRIAEGERVDGAAGPAYSPRSWRPKRIGTAWLEPAKSGRRP
jgi:hypothetical protein